jgi:hypothetical protein
MAVAPPVRRTRVRSKWQAYPMDSRDEYVALRNELISWQERRMSVASQTATAVVAILGLVSSLSHGFMWTLLSSALLLLIAASMIFAIYAADAASRLGAYIRVVHEASQAGWETRAGELRTSRLQNLNAVLGSVYLMLGVLAAVVPPAAAATKAQPWYGWALLVAVAVVFAATLYRLVVSSYSRRGIYEAELSRGG